MCKARRPGQTERGTKEPMHGLKPKNLPLAPLPHPPQMLYRRRTKAGSDVETITVDFGGPVHPFVAAASIKP